MGVFVYLNVCLCMFAYVSEFTCMRAFVCMCACVFVGCLVFQRYVFSVFDNQGSVFLFGVCECLIYNHLNNRSIHKSCTIFPLPVDQ